MTVPAPDSSERGLASSNPPGSPQSPASSRGRGFAWRLLALAVLVPVASLSIFRAIPAQWPTPVVQLLSFTPWMVVPAVLALGLALAGRRVWVNAAAAVLLAAQLFWHFPHDSGRSLPGQSAAATT